MRLEFRLCMGRRKPIPGAYILTNIAAENPVFELSLYRLWDFLLELNSKIRNALGSIHHAWLHNGICGACIYATGAGATVIRGMRGVGTGFKIYDQFSQEKEAPHFSVEQKAVFSEPANSRLLSPLSFQNRGRVYKCSSPHITHLFPEPGQK